jgi:ACS family tartrate transporter-like MFS transporter
MAESSIERETMQVVFRRLLPLLFLCYFASYVDRVNIGFASLTMNADLGLSPRAYGFGAGLFFIGYFIFEVPSNLILNRVGASLWIARIMLTWGLLSMGMAFVTGPLSFNVLRFLLGAAEAGFFPGVILYLTRWCPAAYRSRILANFMVAIPASLAVAAPLSGAIMRLDGLFNLHGWQWLFVIEGAPTLLLAILVLRKLPDTTAKALWLQPAQRDWLDAKLLGEQQRILPRASNQWWRALYDRRVLVLAFIYFANTGTNLGLTFFLPQIVKDLGVSNDSNGFITMIPYLVGVAGILWFGRIADRSGNRRLILVIALGVTALGLASAGLLRASYFSILTMSIAAAGIYGGKVPFWSLPSQFLTGAAAASAIAFINSIGNLGGFVGPNVMGWLRGSSGNFASGLYALAGLSLAGALMTLTLRSDTTGPPR